MLVLESPKFTNPSLVFDDDVMKVWHYQDIIYNTPKGLFLFYMFKINMGISLLWYDYTKPNVYCNCRRPCTE